MSALIFAFTSYQPAYAIDNKFAAVSIQTGDNLLSILRKNGFSEQQREQVLASHRGLRHLFLTLDTKYLIRKTPQAVELRMFDSQTSEAFRIIRNGTSVLAYPYEPEFQIQLQKVEGKIHGSILGSVLAKIKSNWAASRFMDAYVFDLKAPHSVSRGAKFRFTIEKLFTENQFIKYGEVLDTSLEINGSLVHKKFIKHKEGGVFFSAEDLSEERPFYAPVEYIKVASHFAPNRLHPITKRHQPHLGIDFELPIGDPVFAPRKGTVIRYGNNRAAGNYIVLLHANGVETSYNHLHRIDKRIKQGLKVYAGEKIGEIGCSGYCTRAHLHFAIKHNGKMVDPVRFIKSYPSHMEKFLQEKVAKN